MSEKRAESCEAQVDPFEFQVDPYFDDAYWAGVASRAEAEAKGNGSPRIGATHQGACASSNAPPMPDYMASAAGYDTDGHTVTPLQDHAMPGR